MKLTAALALAVVLAACQSPQPTVLKAPVGTQSIETLVLSFRSETANNRATSAKTPPGLRTAFAFSKSGIQSRTDLPSTMFPDARARSILADSSLPGLRLLFKDSGAFDAKANALLADNQQQQPFPLMDTTRPFAKLTLADFDRVAKRVGFDTVPQSGQIHAFVRTRQQASRVKVAGALPEYTIRETITFDATIGAVANVETLVTTPDSTQLTKTNITYAAIDNLPDTSIPVEFTATSTYKGQARNAPNLPVADINVPQNANAPALEQGYYVAQRFTAPEGNKNTNYGEVTTTSTVRLENVEINAVSADFVTGKAK
jgi:hypothetical protein